MRTRRRVRNDPKPEPKPYVPMCWNRFLQEGEILFEYMTQNFETFFDGDSKLSHFNVRDAGIYDIGSQEVLEKYDLEIQKKLSVWIRNEYDSGRLFVKTDWKPFRDAYDMTYAYLGYRRLFQFKQYYFQLAIESECARLDCEWCPNDDYYMRCEHFSVELYGWKNEDSNMLQPDGDEQIPHDLIITEKRWKRM
jgi:hypothetical protein